MEDDRVVDHEEAGKEDEFYDSRVDCSVERQMYEQSIRPMAIFAILRKIQMHGRMGGFWFEPLSARHWNPMFVLHQSRNYIARIRKVGTFGRTQL